MDFFFFFEGKQCSVSLLSYVFFAETDLLGTPVMERPIIHSYLLFHKYLSLFPILNLNYGGALLQGVKTLQQKKKKGIILNVNDSLGNKLLQVR